MVAKPGLAAQTLEPIDYERPIAQPMLVSRGNIPGLPFEVRWKRYLFVLLAIAISAGYLSTVLTFWTPAHQGVDQNGYLVGGKMFAETLSMKQAPKQIANPDKFDPHQFIANMWVSATNNPQHFYPKYPLGLPLLYAIALWVGGGDGVALAHLISPIAMALTVLGVFFLTRQFTGSFPAVLAMLVYATSPVVTWCVNNPNSHSTTVFCCVWGMLAVLHWWRMGGWGWALLGGFLVGYAATIRYTEGALLLPIVFAALINLRWRVLRSWIESSLIVVGWLIPVSILLTYNYLEMGTLTGYDATNESTGFSWAFFYDNWETITRQLSENGLFFIMPIAIAGLIAMFWWNWRVAMFLWLWVGPCVTIYTFYYWAPDGVGYLRFVLTVLPPMVAGAFWLIAHIRDLLPKAPQPVPAYLMILVLTFGGLTAGVLGHFALRLDLPAISALKSPDPDPTAERRPLIMPMDKYLDPAPSVFATRYARPVFFSSLIMLSAWGAAIAASALLKRAIVPTLAAGVIAFLSVAVQADNSIKQLERDAHDRAWQAVNYQFIAKLVPPGSILISRDEGLLHQIQFEQDLITFNGMTFDKGWVNGRPNKPTDDPVLMDPVRGKQLQDSLKDFDQKALTEQARQMVTDAIKNNRRVFVVDSVNRLEDLLASFKDKKEPKDNKFAALTPDFIRRHIIRPKDESIKAERIAWWNTPQVSKDPAPSRMRGRRDARGWYRVATCQLWEIKVP